MGPARAVGPCARRTTAGAWCPSEGPPWDLPLWDEAGPTHSPRLGEGASSASGLPPDRPQLLDCLLHLGDLLFLPVGSWRSLEALEAVASLSFAGFPIENPLPGQ